MPTLHVIKNKNMQPIPQDNNATCWLAAYQMMFDWKGKPKDSIPLLLKGAVPDVALCYAKGLDRPQWDKAAKAFGLKSHPGKKPFTAADLAVYIANGPVLVHGQFPLGMHSIVVTGVSVADYPWELNEVIYINPFWQGVKKVVSRTSPFKHYMDVAVENNAGFAGVIQHW